MTNSETLLQEMSDIALDRKYPQDTVHFAKLDLAPQRIKWGCLLIMKWLRTQAVQMRPRPAELNPAADLDAACIDLVRAVPLIGHIVDIREDRLRFSPALSPEETKEIMKWAQENYRPPILL